VAITIREAVCEDSGGIARVHVESWQTTYRGIMPADYLANLKVEQRQTFWSSLLCAEQGKQGEQGEQSQQDQQIIYVAADAGQIIGFASGGAERSKDKEYDGELYAIYLLASYQRKGLGRELLRPIAEGLEQAGKQSMLVWVLAENPSRGFYEALGGQAVRSQLVTIGEMSYEETGYGWSDLGGLIKSLQAVAD
jgi:GNAT superfamily N-acetyltransferase